VHSKGREYRRIFRIQSSDLVARVHDCRKDATQIHGFREEERHHHLRTLDRGTTVDESNGLYATRQGN